MTARQEAVTMIHSEKNDTIYKKTLNAYKDIFNVWKHSYEIMVIGHEARLITPYNLEGDKFGFFAVFESPPRGKTLKAKLEAQGSVITQYGEWEMCGWFPSNKLLDVAKVLNIAKKSQKKVESGKLLAAQGILKLRLAKSAELRENTPV